MGSIYSSEDRLLDAENYEDPYLDMDNVYNSFIKLRETITIADAMWSTPPAAWDVRNTLKYLLPSFVMSSGREQHAIDRQKLRPTTYLDGVRGIACFCVYFAHTWGLWADHLSFITGELEAGFHSTPADNNIMQLPLFRLIYSGAYMVQIFLILSGYVLSRKPLQLIRASDHEALSHHLSSAIFRRGIRLFLPISILTLFCTIVIYAGYYGLSFTDADFCAPKETFGMQIYEWWLLLLSQLKPFRWDHDQPPYSGQLWTIPVEFRCSIIVFVLLQSLGNLKSWIRLTCLVVFTWFSLFVGFWDVANFVSGMILAELSLIRRGSGYDFSFLLRKYASKQTISTLGAGFWSCTFILALYLGCFPYKRADITYGYETLARSVPSVFAVESTLRMQYWCFWGSALLLLSLENYPVLQRPFTAIVPQYLGKISYALYLVHIPLGLTINRWIILQIIGSQTASIARYVLALSLTTVVNIWVSDIFWRLVDLPCIQLSKDLRKWCENSQNPPTGRTIQTEP